MGTSGQRGPLLWQCTMLVAVGSHQGAQWCVAKSRLMQDCAARRSCGGGSWSCARYGSTVTAYVFHREARRSGEPGVRSISCTRLWRARIAGAQV
eukprot:6205973-Prorocentrum_lima.AAC.1